VRLGGSFDAQGLALRSVDAQGFAVGGSFALADFDSGSKVQMVRRAINTVQSAGLKCRLWE
jgi:hypothetical protein